MTKPGRTWAGSGLPGSCRHRDQSLKGVSDQTFIPAGEGWAKAEEGALRERLGVTDRDLIRRLIKKIGLEPHDGQVKAARKHILESIAAFVESVGGRREEPTEENTKPFYLLPTSDARLAINIEGLYQKFFKTYKPK